MTEQKVHEALCKASDEDKMKIAIACQMNNTTPQEVEKAMANILTNTEESMKLAIEYFKYLGGSEDEC